MNSCIVWHNPRCSISRHTLALLRDHGLEPIVVEYLKDVPNIAEIENAAIGRPPKNVLNIL